MRVRIGLTILVVLFLVGSIPIPNSSNSQINNDSSSLTTDSLQNISPTFNNHLIAEHIVSGILEPLTIEQRGNWTTQTTPADSAANAGLTSSLEVDSANDWVGSKAYVNLWNLERLYIANGSLDDGIVGVNTNPTGNAAFAPYGWDAISYSSDASQQMITEYIRRYTADGSQETIAVRSKGPGTPGNYKFREGSYVYWIQNVTNTPHLDQFIFSLDYSYDKGPLNENVALRVLANDTLIWNVTASNLEVGVPYSTGDLLLDFSGFSGQFEFRIGLYFDANVTHSQQFIEFTLDNIRLVGQTAPDFDDLDIDFHINSAVTDVTGTSFGAASISNSSLWTEDVPIELTSTLPVSFDYNASILNHRYINSTYELNPSSQGVSFIAETGSGISLGLYTYFGSLLELENSSIIIYYPSDWENVTVLNPFLTDVTSNCVIYPDFVRIPSNQLYVLGWWVVKLDAKNYLKAISSQESTTGTGPWTNQTVFSTSEYIRSSTTIGFSTENPIIDDPVNVSLYLPNGTLWGSELITAGSGEIINSTGLYLDSSNTTAGTWTLAAIWNNGTEVAFGEVNFEVHHQSELVVVNSLIETEGGGVVTNAVRFRDIESNKFIMDPAASILANWSEYAITFIPNLIQNWWEGTFDTSILLPGEHVVIVNASSQYYDQASTSFVIQVIAPDNNVQVTATAAEAYLQSPLTATFNFTDRYGVGIENSDFDISYTGPSNGLSWSSINELGLGNYELDFVANVSGNYAIKITSSKPFYEDAEDAFILIVGEYGSSLTSLNGTAGIVRYGESYRLVVQYENLTGAGLSGASVSVVSVSPETGLAYGSVVDMGNGDYSLILTPQATGAYTVLIEAVAINHEAQFYSFTITSTFIPTELTLQASSEIIAIDAQCIVTLTFTNESLVGLGGATISYPSLPEGISISSVTYLGTGQYRVNITPSKLGDFQIRFRAHLDNHNDATTTFSLSVVRIPTRLSIETPLSEYSTQFGQTLRVTLLYQRLNLLGEPISSVVGADFLFLVDDHEGFIGSVISEDDHYVLLLSGEFIGSWSFTLIANKTDYLQRELSLTFTLKSVSTVLSEADELICYYGRTYWSIFNYTFESNGTGISGAQLQASRGGSEWITWEDIGDGIYNVSLTPLDFGPYTVEIEFSKDGFQRKIGELSFEVSQIPIAINYSAITWLKGDPLTVSIRLMEEDTHLLITDALVTCTLYLGTTPLAEWLLIYVGAGTYNGTLGSTNLWADSTEMYVLIEIDKNNFYASPTSIQVNGVTNPVREAELFLITYGYPAIGVAATLILLGSVVRVRRKREAKLWMEAVEVKSRFDDANNLLGMLILHKKSGLPFYSKILKGGFEEGMLSAFISAVTHFRGEFEHNGEGGSEWRITPISDIIRAVETKNLICAFVTLTSPSLIQEANMLIFSRTVGMKLDDEMQEPPTAFRHDKTAMWVDKMFDKHLDAGLLKLHSLINKKSLPRKYRPLEEARAVEGCGDQFHLSELSRGLQKLGMEEAKTYYLIMAAMEAGFLQMIDENNKNNKSVE